MFSTKLFRGDKRKNKTLPELYRTDGLLTKQIHGGNPAYIDKNGLLKTIQDHINPELKYEISFHNSSCFLSFSSDIKIAEYYCADGEPHLLKKVEEYHEQRYLIYFDISEAKPINKKAGIYYLEYNCNRNLIKPNALAEIDMNLLRLIDCDFCNKNTIKHSIMLIDVVEFLSQNTMYMVNKNSLKLAEKDKEWLILPTDYYQRLLGFKSNIPRADYWYVDHFIKVGDPFRDVNDDALGQII